MIHWPRRPRAAPSGAANEKYRPLRKTGSSIRILAIGFIASLPIRPQKHAASQIALRRPSPRHAVIGGILNAWWTMFRILFFAGLLLVAAVFMARVIDQSGRAPVAAKAMTAAPAPAPSVSNNSRSLVIKAGNGGHFEVEARVDGRRIPFLVDTGASQIALRESDAARLGIHPTPRDYKVKIHTA